MNRNPKQYRKGDQVRNVHTGKVYTVRRDGYWQHYAGGSTADFTIELFPIEPSQPTPWDKSRNLKRV